MSGRFGPGGQKWPGRGPKQCQHTVEHAGRGRLRDHLSRRWDHLRAGGPVQVSGIGGRRATGDDGSSRGRVRVHFGQLLQQVVRGGPATAQQGFDFVAGGPAAELPVQLHDEGETVRDDSSHWVGSVVSSGWA